ncbi:uncharacterized protein LOC119587009 [Penaeus monodon]|uniref:uncharacterized protein LOC119587009 n=1 Tax=Penaeus monodon TaxID=6687 RepID=UPI0018A6D983|nr:uncharacterized protein LOC119587009 [Penaeus monodon]
MGRSYIEYLGPGGYVPCTKKGLKRKKENKVITSWVMSNAYISRERHWRLQQFPLCRGSDNITSSVNSLLLIFGNMTLKIDGICSYPCLRSLAESPVLVLSYLASQFFLSNQVITFASLLVAASAKPSLSQSYQAPGSSFGDSVGTASLLRPAINFGGIASGGAYSHPVAPVTRQYNFNYAINDAFGNDFGHQEGRDGYNTQGSYYVQLPDGRLQRVTYTVNGNQGYVAQVTYEGVAQYPAFQPSASYSPAPSYG